MRKKLSGTIQDGPYRGQSYKFVSAGPFPRWYDVWLETDDGCGARREVPERVLEDA